MWGWRAQTAEAVEDACDSYPAARPRADFRESIRRANQERSLNSPFTPFSNDAGSHRAAGDLINDYRARRALEEQERAQRRRIEIEEQRSDLNPPNVRIRAWEKLHGLRLPASSTHRILDIIAVDTRLTLAEVQEEQQARAAAGPRRRRQKAAEAKTAAE